MPWKLVGVSCKTDTRDNDKDPDTKLRFELHTRPNGEKLASVYDIVGGFPDNTTNGPFALNLTDYAHTLVDPDYTPWIVAVGISKGTTDQWNFVFHIRLEFLDYGTITRYITKKSDVVVSLGLGQEVDDDVEEFVFADVAPPGRGLLITDPGLW